MGAEAATRTWSPPLAVHASAVAIGGRALMILGPSKSGKSRLAAALVAAGRPGLAIRLVGDDRILLTPTPRGLMARPHPRIAGFLERRGLGIVAMPYVAVAPVAGCVTLSCSTTAQGPLENFPVLSFVHDDEAERSAQVLRWWMGRWGATSRQQVSTNASPAAPAVPKD